MAYNAWADGYERALQCKANRYDPDVSIHSEHVGNWIVSAKFQVAGIVLFVFTMPQR